MPRSNPFVRAAKIIIPAVALVALAASSGQAAPPEEISSLHPRIFVRNDSAFAGQGLTVSGFRARGSDPAYSAWSDLTGGEANWEGILTVAARYLMYGNAPDLQTVRDWLVSQLSPGGDMVTKLRQPGNMAAAFDWCYDGFSPADRTTIMSNIKAWTDGAVNFLDTGGPDVNHNYTYMAIRSVALAGLALKGETGFDATAAGYLAKADTWLEGPGRALETYEAKAGSWSEGNHYNFLESIRHLILTCLAYKTASSRDYFRLIRASYGDFFTKTAGFYMYNMRPDFTWERIGDMRQFKPLPHNEIRHVVEALCLGLPDPTTAAMLHSFSDALGQYCGTKAVHRYYKWGMMMFYDTSIPTAPSYTSLPLAARMGSGTFEQVVFRSGWAEDSTMITFLSGNHFTDHQHFDKGHFQIYHKGGITADAGAYDNMYSLHHKNFASRTVAHNSLLVYNPGESFPAEYVNDGGQRVIRNAQHHETWDEYVSHLASEHLDAADLESFEYDSSANVYTYARGNLAPSYSAKVTHCDRQLLYLNSRDFLVVYDRVSSSDASYEKAWLLHTMQGPLIDGVTPATGVTDFAGASWIQADRTGSLDVGGKTVNYAGRIFCASLLPESRVLSAIGGSGYEYYVRGTNYPPMGDYGSPREAGSWRVEVKPSVPANDDQFLHVFQNTDTSTAVPAPVSILRDVAGKAIGARIEVAPEEQVVLFNANQLGGSMTPPISYEVSTARPSRHLICELPPNMNFTVDSGGNLQAAVSSAEGILSFLDRETGLHSLEVSPGPGAAFAASPTSGPPPLAVQFTDQSVGNVTTWLWDFGDGNTSSAQDPQHIYASAGTYTVSLTVSGPEGSDTETKNAYITVASVVVAEFHGSPTTGNAPLAVAFTDDSIGRVSTWSWTFGDGGTSTEQNPQHTYTSGGAFTVSLTVSGADGTDTETKGDYIKLAPVPPAGLTASDGTYDNKVEVSWNAVAGATHYRLFRNNSDTPGTATALGDWQSATSFSDSTAASGVLYYYWVKSKNAYGESGFSSSDTGYRRDEAGPIFSELHPAAGATAVAPETVISVRVSDPLSGADTSSLRLWVANQLVYSGSDEIEIPDDADQWKYVVDGIGTGRRHGDAHDFRLVFDAEPDFPWGHEVPVELDVYDNAGNHSTGTWVFRTAPRWFGRNVRVSDQSSASRQQGNSQVVTDSAGSIYVVWEQTSTAADTDIYIGRSTDGGQAFDAPVAIAASGGNQTEPALTVGPGNALFAVWQDDTAGTWDIRGAASADGQTWVQSTVSADVGNQTSPVVAWDTSGVIYVVYQDDRYASIPGHGSFDMLGATSADGINWTPVTIASLDGDQTAPAIALDDDLSPHRIWVAWEDTRGSTGKDIYASYSDDGGAHWTEVPLVVALGEQEKPHITACDGDWQLAYSGPDADLSTGICYLEAGMPGPVKVDDGAPDTNQTAPCLGLDEDGGQAFAVWADDGSDAGDILFSESSVHGQPAFGRSALVNDDSTGNLQSQPHLAAMEGDGIAVSMTDARSGVPNVYFAGSGPCVLAHEQPVKAHEDTLVQIPAGNVLEGMSVHIPAGAFPVDTALRIYEVRSAPAGPGGKFGPVVRIGPSGPPLAGPLTISIPHPADLPHDSGGYYVHRYSFADSQWKQNEGITNVRHLDAGAGQHLMRFETSYLSIFAASASARTGGGGGGGCFTRKVHGAPPEGMRDVLIKLGTIVVISLSAVWITRRLAGRGLRAAQTEQHRGQSPIETLSQLVVLLALVYVALHSLPLP